MFTGGNLEQEKLLKWPKVVLVHRSILWMLERDKAVFTSLVIFYYSYFYASVFEIPALFSSSGATVSAVGLLLTLKHNFISVAQSPHDAVAKHHQMGRMSKTNIMENPAYVNPAIIALKDEYVGIILVLLGGLVSGYGGFIPLLGK
ncbi:hypothetical protein CYQ90_23420 [Vibrio parahaemolyticus]|nr:hypothetical protein [Vibrio parahaemolyticus]RPB32151.1 hypothetical protein CYQ90_23420 [Vibrio parahaemolyticus]